MPSSNHIAFTSPINPPGTPQTLTKTQIWNALLQKIRSAETFVPKAISNTTIISESTDASGYPVTVREVTFIEGNRKVEEVVTAYEDCRVEFKQPDGSTVSNVISEGAEGELYMTYIFEWKHERATGEELEKFKEKEKMMSKMAVEGTIAAMRGLSKDGKI